VIKDTIKNLCQLENIQNDEWNYRERILVKSPIVIGLNGYCMGIAAA
jgi:hypothetical protein